MKFKSEHMTQASGSIAGVTYGRAKGGTLYRRARAIPVNPQSNFQTQVRSALTDLVNRWNDVLTPAQRNSWTTYGANVLFTNKLGDPGPLSGQNCYVGANTARMQNDAKLASALGIVDSAPTIFDRGDFTTPTVGAYSVATGLTLLYNDGDAWNDEDLAAMLIFMGRPRNPGRAFFKGPWRLIAGILGVSPAGPVSPLVLATGTLQPRGFQIIPGQRISTAALVVRADGRWSTRRKLNDVTAVA